MKQAKSSNQKTVESMTINIIKEPDIYITESELHRLRRDYDSFCQYHVSPPPFESFCRNRKNLWNKTIEDQSK